MLTTEIEWGMLTDEQRLVRLREVEMDRDNLREFVRHICHSGGAPQPVPAVTNEAQPRLSRSALN